MKKNILLLVILMLTCSFGGCSLLQRETAVSELLQDKDGNFEIWVRNVNVGNSSIEIKVLIDGKVALDDDFDVDKKTGWFTYTAGMGQKGYCFMLGEGRQEIYAVSENGKAEFKALFETERNKKWGYLDYIKDKNTGEGYFEFKVLDYQLKFL